MSNRSCFSLCQFRWLTMLWLALQSLPGLAQSDYNQWYFGAMAGVVFPSNGGAPTAVANSAMVSGEGCASISDARGNLLFYTNGIQAWNFRHQQLANGFALGAFSDGNRTELPPNSATQGVVVVPNPGSLNEYYIFTLDAAENDLRNGLSYSVVDMSRQGGLGEVVLKNVRIPVPVGDGRIAEKMTVVRHANERDIWVTVHGWGNNVFCSYLLTPNGVSATPVLSAAGSVHRGGGRGRINPYDNYNSIGAMKVSPNGRRLAVAQFNGPLVELFDFNHGTGVVSNARIIDNTVPSILGGNYGVEFSPNSNLLYVSSAVAIRQFDLLTLAATSIVPTTSPVPFGALQLGPDGRIYHCNYSYLNVILAPNQPGIGCGYTSNAVLLNQVGIGRAILGLPGVLVRPPSMTTPLVTFGVAGTSLCLGERTVFSASIFPAMPGATVTWDFGEPAAGTGNAATGLVVTHRYANAGTFNVAVTLVETNGRRTSYSQAVVISTPDQLRITGPSGTHCVGDQVNITATISPTRVTPATFLWQDGSVGSSYVARTSGLYRVEVYTPGACTARDSIRLNFQPLPVVDLGLDRPLPCEESEVLNATVSIPGSIYRWQDGSTNPTFRVDLPGTYTVAVSSPAGCNASSSVRIGIVDCTLIIPNIITPNGDGSNDRFVIKGIAPGRSSLSIYNRWGKEVYKQSAYANEWEAAGEPAGIYYYALFVPITNKHYKGWLEVIK